MKAPASRIELAIYVALCLLTAAGIGLTCASAPIGFVVAGVGVAAVAAYGAAGNLDHWMRVRREHARSLSVTEIAGRQRPAPPISSSPVAAPAETADISKPANTDRVVSLKMHSFR